MVNDDDAVACRHALGAEHARESGNLIQQFFVADASLRLGNGAVMYDRRLIAPAGIYMNIHRVVAGIGDAIWIPAVKRRITVVQYSRWRLIPENVVCGLLPQFLIFHLRDSRRAAASNLLLCNTKWLEKRHYAAKI